MNIKLLLILSILGSIIILPNLMQYDPMQVELEQSGEPPSWQHILGTDMLGRDVFSRLLYGGRVSLFAAFMATSFVSSIGAVVGISAGYFRGIYDETVQFVIEALLIFPGIIIALVTITLLGRGVIPAIIAVSVSVFANYLQVARAASLTVSSQEYIVVAKSLGATHFQILFRHVLPNCFSILLSYAGVIFAYSLLSLTALGFLGLSTELGQPEWGNMIAEGFKYYRVAPWISGFPAIAISICVVLINLIIDDVNQMK